jgi:hypothetical protein
MLSFKKCYLKTELKNDPATFYSDERIIFRVVSDMHAHFCAQSFCMRNKKSGQISIAKL